MDFLTLTTILSTVSTLVLGTFVFLKNKRNRTHQLFSTYCLFVALWAIVNYYALTEIDKADMLTWMRLVMALATAQSVSILLFMITYPSSTFNVQKKKVIALFVVGLLTFVVALTPYLFSDVELSSEGKVRLPVVAPGILLFIIVTIGSIVGTIIITIKKYLHAVGIIKLQLRYILSGLILMYAGIIYFSFINVVVFLNSEYVYLGSLFIVPFILLTSYSMLRYRFMDIKVVVRRSIVYGSSLFLALGVYTLIALALKTTIEDSWNVNPTWTAIMLIVVVALGFPQLKKLVEKSINKVFKGRKSIDLAVKEVREKIFKKTNIQELTHLLAQEITQYLSVKQVKVFVLQRKDALFINHAGENINQTLSEDKSDIINLSSKRSEITVYDEVPHLLEEGEGAGWLEKGAKEMKKRNVSVVVPLYVDSELFGLFAISEKEDKSAFTVQDIEYLERVRDQVVPTIANALLYQDAMERIGAVEVT